MSIYEPLAERDGRRVLQLRSPVDLKPTGELVCANKADVSAAVAKARAALPAWSALSFEQRAAYMYRVMDLIVANQDRVTSRVIAETGKAPGDALSMEVYASLDSLNFYARRAAKFLATEKTRPHGPMGLAKQVRIVYKPIGVVGIIVPWNGPFILALNPAVQALMAGNTVLLKGSEVTPRSTQLVEELFREAGLPDGVLQAVMGDGETGATLIESGVDKISFTGSVATGRKVAAACGQRLIPCTLELGGKDAMIVCDDADINRAASGALIGSCMNTGHYCCGTERIYVLASVYDRFVANVVERAKALRQGQQHGDNEDVGAVFWDKQLTIIERQVDDAKSKGAKILVGGRRNPQLPGLYFEPTVMVDVTHDMEIMREENFGPVLCIQKVNSVDEAIRLANDSIYGLNGSVFTSDREKGFDIARRIETGSVNVNDMAVTYGIAEAPFGGVKESGVGRVNGKDGIRGYCQAVPIVIDKTKAKENMAGYPYDAKKLKGMRGFIKFLFGTKFGRWLAAL